MNVQSFERELRRRHNNAGLVLRRDAQWARAHGLHPDSWQVWDTLTPRGDSDCVFICESKGRPVEPNEMAIKMMWDRWSERPGGIRSRHAADERARESEELAKKAFVGIVREGYKDYLRRELWSRLRHLTGHGRVHRVVQPSASDRLISRTRRRKIQKSMREQMG